MRCREPTKIPLRAAAPRGQDVDNKTYYKPYFKAKQEEKQVIKANLETGKLEMKGIEPVLYAEVGMVVKGFYKVIKENNPENPHLARILIERLVESATMTDEEVESELKRYENEHPDLSIMADIMLDVFTGR